MAEQPGDVAGGLGDVDDGYVEQLLQALAAVLAEPGLNHRVERPLRSW